jgi:hypothetical protein
LICEAAEDCALPREDYLTPGFTAQAEALVRGIYASPDGRPRCASRAITRAGLTQDAGEIRTRPQSRIAVARRVDVV